MPNHPALYITKNRLCTLSAKICALLIEQCTSFNKQNRFDNFLFHITILDGFDENSIVGKYYLYRTALEITVEFGDEGPYTFCVLYVTEFLFSTNAN